MHSTITNYTANIDVAFPIAGQSNDPQGFRDNFYNIREALNWAAIEINTLSQNIHPIVHTNIVIDNSQPKLALSPTGVQPDDGAVLFDNQDALIEISPTFNGKSIMNISNAQDISLNNQKLVGSVYLGHTAPGSLSGQIGDQKGQMVLDPNGSYIATQDYSGPANVAYNGKILNGTSWTKLSDNIESNKMVVVKPSQLYSPTSPTPNIICDLSLGTRFFINHPGTDLAINFINLPPSPCQVEAFVTIKTGPDRNNVIQQIFIEGGAAQVVMNSKIGTFKDNAGNPLTYNPDTPGWGYKRWITIVSPKPNDYTVFSVEGVFLGPRVTYSGVSGQSLVYTPPAQGARYAPGSSVPSEGPLTINGIADGGRLNLPGSSIGNTLSEDFTLGGTQYDPTVPYNISHSGTLPTGTTIAVGQNGATLQGSLTGSPNSYSFTITATPQYNPNGISCTITVNVTITSVQSAAATGGAATAQIPVSKTQQVTKSGPPVFTAQMAVSGIGLPDGGFLPDSTGAIVGKSDLFTGGTLYPDSLVSFSLQGNANVFCYMISLQSGGNTLVTIQDRGGMGSSGNYMKALCPNLSYGPDAFVFVAYNGNGDVSDSQTIPFNYTAPYYLELGVPHIGYDAQNYLINTPVKISIGDGLPGQTYAYSGDRTGSGTLDSNGADTLTFTFTNPSVWNINFDFYNSDSHTIRKSISITTISDTDQPTSYTVSVDPPSGTVGSTEAILVTVRLDKPANHTDKNYSGTGFNISGSFTYDQPYYDVTLDSNVTSVDINPPSVSAGANAVIPGTYTEVQDGETVITKAFNLQNVRASGTAQFTVGLAEVERNGGFNITGPAIPSVRITGATIPGGGTDPELYAFLQGLKNGTVSPTGFELVKSYSGYQFEGVNAVYTYGSGKIYTTSTNIQVIEGSADESGTYQGTNWYFNSSANIITVDKNANQTVTLPTTIGGSANSVVSDPKSLAGSIAINWKLNQGNSYGSDGNTFSNGCDINLTFGTGNKTVANQLANKTIQGTITAPDGSVSPFTEMADATGGFTVPHQGTTTPGSYTYTFTLPDGSTIAQNFVVLNPDGSTPAGVKSDSKGNLVPIPGYTPIPNTTQNTPSNQTGSIVGGASITGSKLSAPIVPPAPPAVPPTPPADTKIIDAPSQVTAGQLFNASLNAGSAYANQTVTVLTTAPDGTQTTSQETLDANGNLQYTGVSITQPGTWTYTWTAANGASVSTTLYVAPPASSTPDNSTYDNTGSG